jgi:hypothetical protein
VVLRPHDSTVAEVIHSKRTETAAFFFGIDIPSRGEAEACSNRLERLAADLPVVFFVRNSSLFIGELLETPKTAGTEKENA